MKISKFALFLASALTFVPAFLQAEITVYSGRSKSLVEPLFKKFETSTGIKLQVRYAGTPELAATILEEGKASPADVFFAQDAGALGALDAAGRLAALPESILSQVDPAFRSQKGDWVGVSGRARVLAYSVARVKADTLPASVFELTDAKWKDRVGWVPQNASFQAFVTAMLAVHGEDKTLAWLKAMKANNPKEYAKNGAAVKAIADGEVDVAIVNHYYLFALKKQEGEAFPVANHFFAEGDVGSMINVAGAGVIDTSKNQAEALKLIEFLLGKEAQEYFAQETGEYPLAKGVEAAAGVKALAELKQTPVDLNQLKEIDATLKVLRDAGVLP